MDKEEDYSKEYANMSTIQERLENMRDAARETEEQNKKRYKKNST